jgi:hypothetical protein
LITQVAGDCLLLCRDARDGFDKLSSEARKQSLEGARRRWESSIALALSLQAPVMPVLPQSTLALASASSSSSAPSAHFPIDSSVAAASGSYETSYQSLLPLQSSSLEMQGNKTSGTGVVSIDSPSQPIKIEGGLGVGTGVGGDCVSHVDATSVIVKQEVKTESSSSSSSRGSAIRDSSSNSSGNSSSSSSSSRAPVGVTEALYPAITMKLEDMPVSACRVVNPFSR